MGLNWKIVFACSGPRGVGKISKGWPILNKKCSYRGDMIYLMIKSGLVAPWKMMDLHGCSGIISSV